MITLRIEKLCHNIEGFAPEPPEFVALNRQMKLFNLQRSGRPILDQPLPFISLDAKALGFALQRAYPPWHQMQL